MDWSDALLGVRVYLIVRFKLSTGQDMKASELIVRLSALVAERGDLSVRIWNNTESEFDEVNEIEPRRFTEHQRASEEERIIYFFGIDSYAVGDWSAQLRHDSDET